jgi:DNA polymerase III subunit delta
MIESRGSAVIRVVWSQDDLLAEELVEDASSQIGPDGEVLVLDGDGGLDGLEEAVFAGSLFASERLVVVRNAQSLRKAEIERLATALAADTVPSAVIVVAVSDRTPTALLNALKGLGEVTRLARPRRGELVNWVNKRLQRTGVNAGRDVGATLVEALGESLRDIAQAIDQLALRAGKGGRIERAHVVEHFRPQSEQPIWVLFDAIVRHDGVKAFETLRRQLAAGDEPLPMLGAIVSQIRGIIRTKSIVERTPNLHEGDVARALGVSEGRAGVMRRQSSRLSWEWLVAVHRLCAEADFELKGGEDGAVLPPDVVMERVVAGALDAN